MSETVKTKSVVDKTAEEPFIYARRFQDLRVYKKCRVLARDVFHATKECFPADEKFSLTDQLRRAARSIGAQIAESWAKRRYPAHFVSKLTDADGEQQETQHWLTVAFDCGYFSAEETHRLGALCLEVGAMLGEMMAKSEQFCQTSDTGALRDAPAEYFAQPDPSALTTAIDAAD
jgi:four helix bundle protein